MNRKFQFLFLFFFFSSIVFGVEVDEGSGTSEVIGSSANPLDLSDDDIVAMQTQNRINQEEDIYDTLPYGSTDSCVIDDFKISIPSDFIPGNSVNFNVSSHGCDSKILKLVLIDSQDIYSFSPKPLFEVNFQITGDITSNLFVLENLSSINRFFNNLPELYYLLSIENLNGEVLFPKYVDYQTIDSTAEESSLPDDQTTDIIPQNCEVKNISILYDSSKTYSSPSGFDYNIESTGCNYQEINLTLNEYDLFSFDDDVNTLSIILNGDVTRGSLVLVSHDDFGSNFDFLGNPEFYLKYEREDGSILKSNLVEISSASQKVESSISSSDLLVFALKVPNGGNLGGISGADSLCQNAANSAGFGDRQFKAWLATSSLDQPKTRFNNVGTCSRYVSPDGTLIANDWSDLTDGSLQNIIYLGPNKENYGYEAFTNVLADGSVEGNYDCNGWTSSEYDIGSTLSEHIGASGSPSSNLYSTVAWTDQMKSTCRMQNSILCFEQTNHGDNSCLYNGPVEKFNYFDFYNYGDNVYSSEEILVTDGGEAYVCSHLSSIPGYSNSFTSYEILEHNFVDFDCDLNTSWSLNPSFLVKLSSTIYTEARCSGVENNMPINKVLCFNGQKKYVCSGDYYDCDESIYNQCEVNIKTDELNCGACGNSCSNGQYCSDGLCVNGLEPKYESGFTPYTTTFDFECDGVNNNCTMYKIINSMFGQKKELNDFISSPYWDFNQIMSCAFYVYVHDDERQPDVTFTIDLGGNYAKSCNGFIKGMENEVFGNTLTIQEKEEICKRRYFGTEYGNAGEQNCNKADDYWVDNFGYQPFCRAVSKYDSFLKTNYWDCVLDQ